MIWQLLKHKFIFYIVDMQTIVLQYQNIPFYNCQLVNNICDIKKKYFKTCKLEGCLLPFFRINYLRSVLRFAVLSINKVSGIYILMSILAPFKDSNNGKVLKNDQDIRFPNPFK